MIRRPLVVRSFVSLAGGLLLAMASPAWSLWPFAVYGLIALAWTVDTPSKRTRFCAGWLCAFAMFVLTLWWMQQFNAIGWILLAAFEATLVALAMLAVPHASRLRLFAFPAALTLVELIRIRWPLGGFPMGGFSLGQAEGPFLPVARVFGEPGVVFVVALIAVAVLDACRRRLRRRRAWFEWALIVSAFTMITVGKSISIGSTGTMEIAAVQGGGQQGLSLPDQRPDRVFADQQTATDLIPEGIDLIVWPENTVAVNNSIEGTTQAEVIAGIARSRNTAVAAGVVEYQGKRFHNAQVLWDSNGNITGRYEKLHRVPFGEYIPGRAFIEKLADVSAVPRDVYEGSGNGVLDVEGRPVGVSISYEGFFARRARFVVRNSAEVLIVPTNAASYTSSQVPQSQIAAARFRAVETGRWLVQAAPTGISVIVDEQGNVLDRTEMGELTAIHSTVNLSGTRTPYVRWGDWPLFLLSSAILLVPALTWAGRYVRRGRDPSPVGGEQTGSC